MEQTLQINVNSDQLFTITQTGTQDDWITITPMSGGINGVNVNVKVKMNIDDVRTAEYVVKSNYATCALTITQTVAKVYYLIDKNNNYLIDNQGNYLISY
jgi:hypothetical protein